MENLNDEIILKIQDRLLHCSRHELISKSDYFKVMFGGSFIESTKNVIHLNDVDLDAMQIILKLLWDSDYIIPEKNYLSVLQAACMLQFLQVKQICIEQVKNLLSVDNCLKIWFHSELLEVKEIYSKAKLLALIEFKSIRKCQYLKEMTLEEIMRYLGDVNLQCEEYEVFETLISWFENCEQKNSDNLWKLLKCLDFNRLSINRLNNNETVRKYGLKLDNIKSKRRNTDGYLCFLVKHLQNTSKTVFLSDNYERKRKYSVLDESSDFSVFSFINNSMEKLFDLIKHCHNLDGFKMIGHKNLLFFFGGEYLLGKGTWNYDFLIYNTITEKWTKNRFPYQRRHFQTCVSGNYFFIVGGTGNFRVIQDTMFFYDISKNNWSEEIKLPCSSKQIKCCNYQNQLFVFDLNNKCGYYYNTNLCKWTTVGEGEKTNLPSFSKNLKLFTYNNRIYIDHDRLEEFVIENNCINFIKEIKCNTNQTLSNRSHIESVLCNNILYTLIQDDCDEKIKYSIEILNVSTFRRTEMVLNQFDAFLSVFSLFHPDFVQKNDLINDHSN